MSIPFSQVSAQGVNTTFVEARLQLDVTPHITSDGSILMAIKATNNQPDPSNTGANGQPAISKKEAETQVLVQGRRHHGHRRDLRPPRREPASPASRS